jgi:DAK2 domain fusion protein YloV
MATLTTLGPGELRRAVESFRDALRDHQEELNRLNVYPVPDGDTGTNMALTLEAVCKELTNAESMSEVCRAISRGSLMGARGNSGVITSQILRGITEVVAALPAVDAASLVLAFRRAADEAYEAVLRPVEGTILTVVRETAEALERASGETADTGAAADLVGLLVAAHVAARDAVARTPELLPALREAGVVDAGGHGFTLFVAALLHVVDGRPLPEPESGITPAVVERHLAGDDIAGLRYEVMYLLDARDDAIAMFRDTWASIGDSIVVVGGDGLWNCHVHTNDIGAAIEAGIEAGRPHEIRVTDLFDEVAAGEENAWVLAAAGNGAAARPPVRTAVVAVAVGDGIQRLLTALGVQQIVAGGQSMNPSTAQILEAVDGCNAPAVVVLPNNKNIVPVAQQVPQLSDKLVEIVPTTSVIEALAALVNYDPDAPISDNVAALSEASLRVRSGEVTQAVRDSHGACGPINQGDWIAIERGGGIVAALGSAADACTALLDRLVEDESEIVTVVVGSDARPADNARIEAHLKLAHPHVESEFHEGGQPLYPYLVGVE